MDTRNNRFFLGMIVSLLFISGNTYAQQTSDAVPPPVIDPNVERRSISESDIDSENFEITPFIGFQTIEDFGNDAVYGVRLGYHVSENWFVEAAYGQATAGTTSFEELSEPISICGAVEEVFR